MTVNLKVGRDVDQSSLVELMTDDEPRQHAFYASLGLREIRTAYDGRRHSFFRMK